MSSSSSSLPTVPITRSRRAFSACMGCRKRKVKCEATSENDWSKPCARCAKKGIRCEFELSPGFQPPPQATSPSTPPTSGASNDHGAAVGGRNAHSRSSGQPKINSTSTPRWVPPANDYHANRSTTSSHGAQNTSHYSESMPMGVYTSPENAVFQGTPPSHQWAFHTGDAGMAAMYNQQMSFNQQPQWPVPQQQQNWMYDHSVPSLQPRENSSYSYSARVSAHRPDLVFAVSVSLRAQCHAKCERVLSDGGVRRVGMNEQFVAFPGWQLIYTRPDLPPDGDGEWNKIEKDEMWMHVRMRKVVQSVAKQKKNSE
ncbi:hypothetical protein FB45DRAFT_874705 [Roridomyces roridus]|uniref:Zn(2)-C6 fungal-type domain-containing protein n=1 Tax=Roridomyces roridus TaxID=1738132 RepID=A0AAD7FD84_9AGAR|nr:hypothetical protein FB45DRAFT_874705 [Roridomyces roridus]